VPSGLVSGDPVLLMILVVVTVYPFCTTLFGGLKMSMNQGRICALLHAKSDVTKLSKLSA
jgi:hypothetical protein